MHKQSIPGHLSPFMEPVYNAKSFHHQIVNDRHQFYSKECCFCVDEMASNCAFIDCATFQMRRVLVTRNSN